MTSVTSTPTWDAQGPDQKKLPGSGDPARLHSISPTWPPAVWTVSGNSAFRWDFAAGALLVQEAGVVSDIGGGSRHLETGNVITANIRLHREIVDGIRPHLPSDLRA